MKESDERLSENIGGIFVIGSSSVGKRTLVSRLLCRDFEDASDSSQFQQHGWTIDTKYYSADVLLWMSHLHNAFSLTTLPFYSQITALVMVFDLNDLSSFVAIREWVSRVDIHKFEILLCIGNKVDLIPGHPVHTEYRRRLQKLGELSDDPHPEFDDFGILETEGTSLLGDEEPSWDIRRSCLEWCTEHNIEYIEACASNADFDKCLSVHGDSQGIERLYGALSAHMWPGMVLKSGNMMARPMFPAKEEMSEDESDYEFEYEVLSAGSAEPYDDSFGGWISVDGSHAASNIGDHENKEKCDKEESHPSTSNKELQDEEEESVKTVPNVEESDKNNRPDVEECDKNRRSDEVEPFDFEDLEQLMSEIGNVRDSLRFMPDFQRREMAANLALKMAAMFGGGSDDEEEGS